MNTEKYIKQAKLWTKEKTLQEAHYTLGKLHVLIHWSDATDSDDLYQKLTVYQDLVFGIIESPEDRWQVLLMIDEELQAVYETLLDR